MSIGGKDTFKDVSYSKPGVDSCAWSGLTVPVVASCARAMTGDAGDGVFEGFNQEEEICRNRRNDD